MAFVVARDASALGEPAARLKLEGDIMKTVDEPARRAGAAGARALRERPAEDALRQAPAPRHPGDLRGARPRRPDDDRRSGGAAGAARRRWRSLTLANRSSIAAPAFDGRERRVAFAHLLFRRDVHAQHASLATRLCISFRFRRRAGRGTDQAAHRQGRRPAELHVQDRRQGRRCRSLDRKVRALRRRRAARHRIGSRRLRHRRQGDVAAAWSACSPRSTTSMAATTACWQRVAELRALQDKPADKLIAGLRLKAMAQAAKADGPTGDAYQARRRRGDAARARAAALSRWSRTA